MERPKYQPEQGKTKLNDPKKGLEGQLGIPPPPEQQPQGRAGRSPEFDLPAQGEGSAPVDGGSESAIVQHQTTPQKEGRIAELIQFLGGYDAIREALAREQARRYLAENYYKVMPDPEEEAWRRERERKYLETATPEEKHEFHKIKTIRYLQNLWYTSDQLFLLGGMSPDYAAIPALPVE